jgi:four helix bundle protein
LKIEDFVIEIGRMTSEELRSRTKAFAGEILRYVDHLPKGVAFEVIGKQLIRSGTSVAANYRAACRAKSQADFINKLAIVVEEADETLFWFEMLMETRKIGGDDILKMMDEANQIIAIFAASLRTARKNRAIALAK